MNIKLLTHDDKDGIACYIALRCFYQESDISLTYCKYSNISANILELVKEHYKYDIIYITDLSLSKKDVITLSKISHKVKLFDHHSNSLEFNKYDWATVLVEQNFVLDNSDTDLYKSLNWSNELSTIYREEHTQARKTCAAELFKNYLYKLHNVKEKSEALKNLDIFIESTRRFDTWEWQNKYEDLGPKKLNDLLDILGIDRFVEQTINRIKDGSFTLHLNVDKDLYVEKELPINFTDIDKVLLQLKKEEIEREIKKKHQQIIAKKLGELNIGVVFAEKYISDLGYALCNLNPHFDLIALISPNAISFRTIREDLDMSKIAEEFGGGGHSKVSQAKIDLSITSKMIDKVLSPEKPLY